MREVLFALTALASAEPPHRTIPQVTVVAHRGLTEGMPENSIAAFRRSIERGIPIIEVDVRTTRDGHLFILHDETLDRTTNCSGSLAAKTRSQLESCRVEGGERLPAVADALHLIRDRPARLLLDIKSGTRLDQVIRQVREHQAEAKVIFGLRRATDIARVRREMPGAMTLAFVPEIRDAPMFAEAGADVIRLWSDWVDADPGQVARTRALGPQVWVMVGRRLPRDRSSWRALHGRMIASGAEGLITDRPELISVR